MNRAERRRARRDPAMRRMIERRREREREHQARQIIAARRRAGLTEEVYEALDDEAREYIRALERRIGGDAA